MQPEKIEKKRVISGHQAMEQRAGELETEVMQLQRCLQMAQSQEGIDRNCLERRGTPNEG